MATNNYDRMHRGEAPASPAIANRATQKKRAARNKARRGWTVFGMVVGIVILLSLVGVVGATLQSLFLGILGWAGIAACLVAVALCVLSLTGALHRRRKWTKSHRTLLIGVACLAGMVLLLLHLAVDKAYNATLSADGYITYKHYLSACFNDGAHTVGGVAVGWLAYPFLNVIGQKVSCIVLAVLCSAVLFSMIWPFWTITQSHVVQPHEEQPAAETQPGQQQPQLFVETVEGARTSRPRRRGKREVFDFAYPNKDIDEEPEAIDQIDENDPTYKRLMREEPDPEKRRLMAKELLLEMTDEEVRRYLGTPEYDPAQDSDSPLQYGRRDSTVARFGDPKPTPTSDPAPSMPASTPDAPPAASWQQPVAPETPPRTNSRDNSLDILFGEEPTPRNERPDETSGFAGTVDSRGTSPAPSRMPPTTPNTGSSAPPPPRSGSDPTYIVNPRRSLDDLPRRARPTPPPTSDRRTEPTHTTGSAQTGRNMGFLGGSPLTPADVDGRTPDRYPAFADESALDRALQQMDDIGVPPTSQPQEDRDFVDYDEEFDEEEVMQDKDDFDPAASRVGYVEREEQEFPSAFDGFVARPAPEPAPEPVEEEPAPDENVRPHAPAVPDAKTERQARACQPKPAPPKKARPYTAPSLYLLRDFPSPVDMEDYETMYHNIEDAFASYGMQVRVLGHTRGPTYTQYAVQLADGLTFKRVAGYEQDIVRKMRLNVEINIVPKVPNMDAIGVEVVNRTRSTVGLKPLLTSGVFRQDKKLYFALGVDVMGNPYYCDILSGPHMLIAGSSGSGKSVCLNTLICCLLYNYKPDYVKFILIDPKGGVEMDVYNDLPHNLLGQSATTPTTTLKALDWAIEEMERRYGLMRTVNIRSLGEYNDKMLQMGMPRLPYILVIIDELADLMKLNKKMANDMETRISRLTAKARACGIHVIVATQRPSVDVITGTIKNNIPTRVAFRTATQIDSKTILEKGCAEKLYGKGDLFFMANGANELKRLQCPFLSDDEVFAICEDIRANNDSAADAEAAARVFREDALDDAQIEEDMGMRDDTRSTDDNPNGDPMFERVVRYVASTGTVSISRIQREFRMGFARAGYLVDEMEKRGFVGAADPNGSNRPRTVLITPADCDEIFGRKGDDYND